MAPNTNINNDETARIPFFNTGIYETIVKYLSKLKPD